VIRPSGQPVTCPTLVGRARIVDGLRDLLDDVDRNRARVVLLSGEAGIGKSRMVAEARSFAVGRGLVVLEAACFPQDRACPYAPLLDLVRARFAGETSEAAVARAGSYARDLRMLLPELFVSSNDGRHDDDRDPEQARRRLFDGLTHLLSDNFDTRPVLLIIEDLHWCDEVSLDVLMHLVRRTSGRRLLLIGTYRGDEADEALRRWLADLDRERLVQEIPLRPLTRAEVASMLEAIVGGDSVVPASFVDAIDALAEGNPFFV
jgi:predicted ATPase